MPSNQSLRTNKDVPPSRSLAEVLGRSEEVKDLVVEAATELSAINVELKQHVTEEGPLPGVETALEKSEVVEGKVHDASEKLAVVTEALQVEVEDRLVLEGQLAVVTAQGAAARHASLHDELTCLANRTLFNDRLEHGLTQSRRYGRPLAVMYIDLDGFKLINDTHGHDAGDSVLRTVAARLEAAVRDEDTVSRVGGDEFLCVLLEVRDENDLIGVAEKILAAVRAPCDVEMPIQALRLNVTASIGIALCPKDGDTSDVLIRSADTAMYRAKRSRSGFAFVEAAEPSPS